MNSRNSPRKSKEKVDYFVLVMHDRVRSLRTKIADKIIEILREYPLLGEKDLILRLIIEDPEIKEYYERTNSIAYIRSVLWDLVKKRVVLKAKALGDNKHVYFFLPEQLDSLKEKIVMSPKEPGYAQVSISTTTTTVKTNTSPSTGVKKEEEEEEEEDEWIEECLKNNDEC